MTNIPIPDIKQQRFFGDYIANIRGDFEHLEGSKRLKSEAKQLSLLLQKVDKKWQINGIDISRAHPLEIIRARESQRIIEFDTFSPYLIDYIASQGIVQNDNLIPEDLVGLKLAMAFKRIFPSARLVSLYDDHNTSKQAQSTDNTILSFTNQQINNFKHSLVRILQETSVISRYAKHGKDYLLISESAKIQDAELLVSHLDRKGFIIRRGLEITFVNRLAENPCYSSICLRTKHGRWLCEALDAATYLKPLNQLITHIVVLPIYMKPQQDKVWEILRVLNISQFSYHNIFYDPSTQPELLIDTISSIFASAEHALQLK